MLGTNDSKNSIRSDRTLLLISHVHKTLCFSFEAFRAVKLLQQVAANLKWGYFKESTFFSCTLYIPISLFEGDNFFDMHILTFSGN